MRFEIAFSNLIGYQIFFKVKLNSNSWLCQQVIVIVIEVSQRRRDVTRGGHCHGVQEMTEGVGGLVR